MIGTPTDEAIRRASQDAARQGARRAYQPHVIAPDRMARQLSRNLTVHRAEVEQRRIGVLAGDVEPKLPPLVRPMRRSVLRLAALTVFWGASLAGICAGVLAAGIALAG